MVAKAGLEPARPQRHLILNQARLPIPSLGHMCGFLEAPRNLNLKRILGGALPIQQHHWTTRISGWVVVIISPVYSLAPHAGPVRASAHDWRVSFLALLPNLTVFI